MYFRQKYDEEQALAWHKNRIKIKCFLCYIFIFKSNSIYKFLFVNDIRIFYYTLVISDYVYS